VDDDESELGGAIELDSGSGPQRPRRSRVLAVIGAALVALVVGVTLSSTPDRQDLAAADGESVEPDDGDAHRDPGTNADTEPSMTATSSTSAPAEQEHASTTTSGSAIDPSTGGTPGSPAPPDPVTPTTAGHPWKANVIRLRSLKAAVVDGEEVQLDVLVDEEIGIEVSIEGKVERFTIDFGDGTANTFIDADYPMSCHGYLIPAALKHTWTAAGTYTVTLRVNGSQDCATDPASYRVTTRSIVIEVVSP
jgi:hypothetical protein